MLLIVDGLRFIHSDERHSDFKNVIENNGI